MEQTITTHTALSTSDTKEIMIDGGSSPTNECSSTTSSNESPAVHEFSDDQIAAANVNGVGRWKLASAGDFGWGIFAQKDFAPNEFILHGKATRF